MQITPLNLDIKTALVNANDFYIQKESIYQIKQLLFYSEALNIKSNNK